MHQLGHHGFVQAIQLVRLKDMNIIEGNLQYVGRMQEIIRLDYPL